LLLGLKLHVPAAAFIAKLRDRGLVAIGATDNVVRLLPPLNLGEHHIREAVQILSSVCASFETEREAV
jgi:acetylornithine/N-succinyldiaminopimelate aminotransferase